MNFLNRRIDGIIVIIFSIIYFVGALQLEDGIVANNQISAATFPIIVAGVLFFCGLLLALQNNGVDHKVVWPEKSFYTKASVFFIILFFYAFFFEYLGFFLLTFLLCCYLALILKGRLIPSLISSLLIVLVIFLLFSVLLEIHLPIGEIWENTFFLNNA